VLTLGRELARLREARGLTQEQVAKAVGHARAGKVSLWENDDRRPSEPNLLRLADVLGVTPEYLRQFGQAYDPAAPRMTRRQRALAEATATPTESRSKSDVFISHSHSDKLPGDILQQIEALATDGPEMLRLVGSRGMATVWSLIAVLEKHRASGDELNLTIEEFLAALAAKVQHSTPHQKRKHA